MKELLWAIKGMAAWLGGCLAYWLGGLDSLLTALLALIALDYLTGLLKGVCNKNLSSEIGFQGIAHKVLTLLVVALAFVIETLVGLNFPLREIVITFFIANEGLSVLENVAEAGLPIPSVLRKLLLQLRNKNNGEDDEP
ncbi:MAG: holin family protein [Oscillospiraceae bacterium]